MGPLALGGDGDHGITMGLMTMKMMIRLNGNNGVSLQGLAKVMMVEATLYKLRHRCLNLFDASVKI